MKGSKEETLGKGSNCKKKDRTGWESIGVICLTTNELRRESSIKLLEKGNFGNLKGGLKKKGFWKKKAAGRLTAKQRGKV